MKASFYIAAALAAFVGMPAFAQDATQPNVRFCGAGHQGSVETFSKNQNLSALLANAEFRRALYSKLLAKSQNSAWGVTLYDVSDERALGATMGLSHVFTYESVDRQKFRDPRDDKDYYNTTYSIGINTVLFDLTERQIRTIIPTVLMAGNVTKDVPTPDEDAEQIKAIFGGFEQEDSGISKWLASITALPIRYDERSYFQVMPVELSPEARTTLEAAAKANGQSPGAFIRNATTQLEALTAVTFRKPMVPISLNEDGSVAESSQYLANMPECLGQTTAFSLPPPSFQIRLAVEKLAETNVEHKVPGDSGGAYQSELAYGGRYRADLAKYDSLNGSSVVDARTFRFQKSIRFSGKREISTYEQYFKLTSNFMREVLGAYALQDRDWVKENMSSSIIDKKQRDPAAIVKAWKTIVREQMKIEPPPRAKERKDA